MGGVAMSRRSRRRKRGAAAGERARDIDIVAPARPAGAPLSHREASSGRGTVPAQPFPFLCVLDVEATCDEFSGFSNYVHEIIEFPVVVIDLHEGGVVGEFHSYVRPTVNTTLTEFCSRLTGISQAQVDAAPTLPEVLAQFEEWRVARGLTYTADLKEFAFAADGPWDLRHFLHGECARKGIPKPSYFDKWCNVKALFADFYRVKACKIHKMLQLQGMRFEGRLHSGIDDTRARRALQPSGTDRRGGWLWVRMADGEPARASRRGRQHRAHRSEDAAGRRRHLRERGAAFEHAPLSPNGSTQ
jgi:3'-5' exoribonuclease 1